MHRYNVCLIGIGKLKEKYSIFKPNTSYNSQQPSDIYNELYMRTNFMKSTIDPREHFNRFIMINPGPDYKIMSQDLCFYISLVKEENYDWKQAKAKLCKFI